MNDFRKGGERQQKSEITALMSYRNDIQRKLSRLHWGRKEKSRIRKCAIYHRNGEAMSLLI